MDKRKLTILEKAFAAEIDIESPVRLMQSKSKLAKELAEEGYLSPCSITLPGRFPVKIEGYILTHLGRITYCESCDEG